MIDLDVRRNGGVLQLELIGLPVETVEAMGSLDSINLQERVFSEPCDAVFEAVKDVALEDTDTSIEFVIDDETFEVELIDEPDSPPSLKPIGQFPSTRVTLDQ